MTQEEINKLLLAYMFSNNPKEADGAKVKLMEYQKTGEVLEA